MSRNIESQPGQPGAIGVSAFSTKAATSGVADAEALGLVDVTARSVAVELGEALGLAVVVFTDGEAVGEDEVARLVGADEVVALADGELLVVVVVGEGEELLVELMVKVASELVPAFPTPSLERA